MEKIEEKTFVVMFSGGADSTYLLLTLLDKVKNGILKKEQIILYYISHTNISKRKVKKEKEAISKILEKINVDYGIRYEVNEINVEHIMLSTESYDVSYDGNVQSVFWIANVFPFLPDNSLLSLGIISGDDAVISLHKLEHLVEILSSMYHIYDYQFLYEQKSKNVSLYTPLIYKKKECIYSYLEDTGYLDLIWVCEMPTYDGEPCGLCKSCLSHKKAMMLKDDIQELL